jgi:hypothetical protein
MRLATGSEQRWSPRCWVGADEPGRELLVGFMCFLFLAQLSDDFFFPIFLVGANPL